MTADTHTPTPTALQHPPIGRLTWAAPHTRYVIATGVLDYLDATGSMSWHLGERQHTPKPYRALFTADVHEDLMCGSFRVGDTFETDPTAVTCLACLAGIARAREVRMYGTTL